MTLKHNKSLKEMHSDHLIKRVKNSLKYTFVFKLLIQICSIITTTVLVSAISEKEYGVYSVFYSIIALLSMIASFGIENTLQRFIPEYYKNKEFVIANKMFRIASLIRFLSNLIIISIIILFWELLAPIFKIELYKNLFLLFIFIIFFHTQQPVISACLSSYFLHKFLKIIEFIFSLIRIIGYGVVAIYCKTMWWIIVVDLIAYSFLFLLSQLLYIKKIPIDCGVQQKFKDREKKRIFRYAIFCNFNDMGVGVLGTNFDNFIIAMLMSPEAVGAYFFFTKLVSQIERILPTNYFIDVLTPIIFSTITSKDNEKIKILFQLLIKINFIISLPILFFLAIFSRDIIMSIFNGRFLNYSLLFAIIWLFTVINSSITISTLIAQLQEKANIILYSKIFALYNIIADIVLIKYYGIWGAALATGTATIGKNFFIWFFVRKQASFSGLWIFFAKILSFWVFVSSIIVIILYFLQCTPIVSLSIGVFLYAISFAALLRFMKLWNENEQKLLSGVIAEKSKMRLFVRL